MGAGEERPAPPHQHHDDAIHNNDENFNDPLTKVIQHPSTPQRKPGDFVILYCAINLRQERVKTCKFTWFVIGPKGTRSEFFPDKTQQYGGRLVRSQNGGHYITLLLGDLQLNDSGTYICRAECTVDCEPWSSDGNGTALLVADYHSGRVTQGGSNLSALKWQYTLLILNALVLCVVLAISVSMCRKLSKKTALCGFSQALCCRQYI
ncbi:hypothetical protein JZ751_018599 [Albula glossodonta]|uniref:Ig-like domain-containing protein n=1 Tax=Albula glossodonta TaxID=121402 RepID=A0A8T2NND3_9TELE|nr:hypothetical protein JZ751_018599 [Albula glossodonta]